jgi:hypothetical protein
MNFPSYFLKQMQRMEAAAPEYGLGGTSLLMTNDCSGLVWYILQQCGINIHHVDVTALAADDRVQDTPDVVGWGSTEVAETLRLAFSNPDVNGVFQHVGIAYPSDYGQTPEAVLNSDDTFVQSSLHPYVNDIITFVRWILSGDGPDNPEDWTNSNELEGGLDTVSATNMGVLLDYINGQIGQEYLNIQNLMILYPGTTYHRLYNKDAIDDTWLQREAYADYTTSRFKLGAWMVLMDAVNKQLPTPLELAPLFTTVDIWFDGFSIKVPYVNIVQNLWTTIYNQLVGALAEVNFDQLLVDFTNGLSLKGRSGVRVTEVETGVWTFKYLKYRSAYSSPLLRELTGSSSNLASSRTRKNSIFIQGSTAG